MPRRHRPDLLFRPVTELADSIRTGEISARELVQASLDRIEEVEPKVNAFVDVFDEEALAEAAAIGPDDPRPFAGVPIAIKNNRGDRGQAADDRHRVHRRLRSRHRTTTSSAASSRPGFVIVGSTTLPEWGILPTSEARRFGPTGNPWDLDRTPGGSSGGSAAAVAAGMVPIAHGNDGGGSTRIPAACCGLVGLKPQRARISMAPEVGFNFLAQDGVLTRTVAETAQLLDILAGYELGDTAWAPPPGGAVRRRRERASPSARGSRSPRCRRSRAHRVDPVCAKAAHDAAAAAGLARPRDRRGGPAVAERVAAGALHRACSRRCWRPSARSWSCITGRKATARRHGAAELGAVPDRRADHRDPVRAEHGDAAGRRAHARRAGARSTTSCSRRRWRRRRSSTARSSSTRRTRCRTSPARASSRRSPPG